MRRHAKASTAGSTRRRATGLGRAIRRAFFPRGLTAGTQGRSAFSIGPGRLAVSLLAAALATLAVAPSASAFLTRESVATFGPDGTAGTMFQGTRYPVIDEILNRVYVVDSSASKLHGFSTGTLIPVGGAYPVSLEPSVNGIAVDNTGGSASGNIYYASSTGFQSAKFNGLNSAGAPLGLPFPMTGKVNICGSPTVDPDGNIWLADVVSEFNAANRVSLLSPTTGATLKSFINPYGAKYPCDLDLDSNGDMFIGQQFGAGMWKHTAASDFNTATKFADQSYNFIIDRDRDILYAAMNGASRVYAYDTTTASFLYEFTVPGTSFFNAVGVDEDTDQVYVSGATAKQIRIFGPPVTIPDATGTAVEAANVNYFDAELSGTIDDNGPLKTTWRFEISSDNGVTWKTVHSGATTGGQAGVVASKEVTGLSLNTTYKFRVVTNKGTHPSTDIASASISFTTQNAPDASATAAPAKNITGESADLSGTVTDNGPLPTFWRIEVSADGGFSWESVASGSTAGGQANVPVSTTATLLPNNDPEYRFRIVTNKGPGGTDVATPPVVFTTTPLSPVAEVIGATEISDTSARLVAKINPKNSPTAYVIEYGTTPALGSTTTPVDIGAGTTLEPVSHVVLGLLPATKYYFRIAATNLIATTTTSSKSFSTRSDSPPQVTTRGYERVSPAEKLTNVFNPWTDGILGYFAPNPNGDVVHFCVTNSLLDPAPMVGFGCAGYSSIRGGEGWITKSHAPNFCALNHDDESYFTTGETVAQAEEGTRVVFLRPESESCESPPLDPAAPLGMNLYMTDPGEGTPSYTLLTPVSDPDDSFEVPSYSNRNGEYVGASADLGHVVYESSGAQTVDAPVGNFDKVFDWNEGSLSLVSRDPSGNPFTSSASVPFVENVVSDNGERIFFQHTDPSEVIGPPPATVKIYMREGGSVTHEISASECTASCGSAAAELFDFATPDGSKAFLTSAEKLVDADGSSSGRDLYMYTHSPDPVNESNLVLISADGEPADGNEADIWTFLDGSDDGNVVYFIAKGQLVANAPIEPDFKVYRWRWNDGSPTLDYVTGFETGTQFSGWRTTPDGSHLLVNSRAQLDPGDQDTDQDVYRWDPNSGFRCASCQLPEVDSQGDAGFSSISDDGRRIFFSTADALVGADTNGDQACPLVPQAGGRKACDDVYEWHSGTITLVSSGVSGDPTYLLRAGASGRDVFFITSAQMDESDHDFFNDIYDARIGGGFTEDPVPPQCEGESCRNQGTSPPSEPGAGTAVFEGPGNQIRELSRCRKGFVKRKGRCVKRGRRAGRHRRAQRHRGARRKKGRQARRQSRVQRDRRAGR